MVVPVNLKQLQDKSRDLRARRVGENKYVVESASNPSANHVVTVTFHGEDDRYVQTRCTCDWAMYNGTACSHVLAALEYMASLKDRTLSFWRDEASARRQKHRLFRLVGHQDDDGIWITSRRAS